MGTAPQPGPDAVAHGEVTAVLVRLTGLLLRTSGEGAEQVEQAAGAAARGLGAQAVLVVVPDGAAVTVASPCAARPPLACPPAHLRPPLSQWCRLPDYRASAAR